MFLLFSDIFPCLIYAQLCNGSLGDPVVNVTFGAGYGPGSALSAATTNYQYVTNACPVNGYYALLNKGMECNYGWHVLQSDHTGNANGYFMLVDASFEPSDFYLDTVKSLCPNTTYEFAAWMLNMKYIAQSIRPNITFNIETVNGQVLQSYNSGDIPVEQTIKWKQYGFYFTTPSNVSGIVLRMTNNAPGGNGNDLAMDDITFRPCGQLITTRVQGITNDTINVCEGNSNTYNFNTSVSSGYLSPVYQWQISTNEGATWNDISGAATSVYQRQPTDAGDFRYRFTVSEANAAISASCRIASNAIMINVHAKPIVDAGSDRNVIIGNSIILNGKAEGENLVYSWTPDNYVDDITKLTPIVSPIRDIEYVLSARSIYGCANEDKVHVNVVSGIYVPSAFTPDGDGKNDTWRIPFLDAACNATVNVFNRYGQLVYYVKGEAISWDGKLNGVLQPTGTYVYLVIFNTNKLKIRGTVTIIR